MKDYITCNAEKMLTTFKELCLIPAPSGFEHKRAEYCKNWLENEGATGVYIDDALNVVFPVNCENSRNITVFAAHTDTVFPDTEPMEFYDDGEKIHCPGSGDNTASLVALLMLAKFFAETKPSVNEGVLFVCNSCEEGLGNLKGTRQLFDDFEGRISRFISFDSYLNIINDGCAGSHRYEVEVGTAGGHSYQEFGNANAINELSKIVTQIYNITLPEKEGARVTYNVGEISGGTSVNTIAQSAKMLCEYRSDDRDCLMYMQKQFEDIFKNAVSEDVEVKVTQIGNRPCSNIEPKKIEELVDAIKPAIEDVIGEPVICKSASTDCNIPLSLGIPAVCIGVYNGFGMHTRQEWVDKKSLSTGLEVAIKVAQRLAEVKL